MGRLLLNIISLLLLNGCLITHVLFGKNFERDESCVKVTSNDTLHIGVVQKPEIDKWEQFFLKDIKCNIEVPSVLLKTDEPYNKLFTGDHPGIQMYPLDFGYLEVRYILELDIEKADQERLASLSRTGKMAQERTDANNDYKKFANWRFSEKHKDLSSYDYEDSVIFYRKDIDLGDGNVLVIDGHISKIFEEGTKAPVYKEIDAVMKRIIESIKPVAEEQKN